MKRVMFFLFLCTIFTNSLQAQKFGYIDADFVLTQMDEYKEAMKEIQESVSKWRADIDKKNSEVQKMLDSYKAEEILLTPEMKTERKAAIDEKEKEVQELSNKIFGPDGQFFARQQDLIKPAQEKLYEAVQKVARRNKLQFIFTNTEGLTMIYAEPRHDYTEEVIEELGLNQPEENPEDGD